MAFGGFFPGGATWAIMRSTEPDTVLAELAETGFWKPGSLTARFLLHVLSTQPPRPQSLRTFSDPVGRVP